MSFQPIHEMFRDAAGRFAGRAAMEIDGRPVTFRTLEEQSNRLANFLVRSGEAKGAVCGIYAESVAETVVAILATLKAGGIFVILNPALPKARLEVQAAMVRPAWIFTEPRLLGRLRETLPRRWRGPGRGRSGGRGVRRLLRPLGDRGGEPPGQPLLRLLHLGVDGEAEGDPRPPQRDRSLRPLGD